MEGLQRHLGFCDFNSDDIYMFFRRHDQGGRGHLSYQDFNNVMLPYSKEYAALVTDRPDYYISRGACMDRFFNVDTR